MFIIDGISSCFASIVFNSDSPIAQDKRSTNARSGVTIMQRDRTLLLVADIPVLATVPAAERSPPKKEHELRAKLQEEGSFDRSRSATSDQLHFCMIFSGFFRYHQRGQYVIAQFRYDVAAAMCRFQLDIQCFAVGAATWSSEIGHTAR